MHIKTCIGALGLFLVALPVNPALAGAPPTGDIWEDILENYDTNGDGKITGAEWNNVFRDIQSEQQGEKGWTETTKDELKAWLIANGYPAVLASQMADQIMNEYDDNNDGVLSPAELWRFIRETTPGAEPNILPIEPGPVPVPQ